MIKALLAALAVAIAITGCTGNTEINSGSDTAEVDEVTIPDGYIETLNKGLALTKVSESYYKTEANANPISPNIFCADPTAVEYNGRLYVYGTNDHQQYDTVGDEGSNTYGSIKSFVILSTDDMVNWTYHGIIDTEAVAPWIISSWAPSIVSRVEDDGLTHFYLYFSNNGCGVGVITATDPCGPWSDPLGKPLIDGNTEGLTNCPNPFDPGAVIDDNGTGWLSFGGGKARGGSDYMPGVARIVQLGEDMTSFASEFVEIKAPYFFEASELNYINGTYVYTYNNSWESRLVWEIDGAERPAQCSMSYMTTKTPLVSDSWQYQNDYFLNPGEAGLDYSNNHSHLHKYNGRYYMFHHNMLRQSAMGTTTGGFRSLAVVEIQVDEQAVSITPTMSSREGVAQVKNVDARAVNEGETLFTSAGVAYESEGTLVRAAKTVEQGAWIYIKGVDFGAESSVFTAMVKGSGRMEIHLDNMGNPTVAALEFENGEYKGVYSKLGEPISGVHDMYIMFTDKDICLDSWQFV